MSESYTGFAQVYDRFMDDVPYDEWAHFLVSILEKYGSGRSAEGVKATVEQQKLCERVAATQAGAENQAAVKERDILSGLEVERNTVLDLGCGTGTLTEKLADAGYDMIGVDNSQEMLEIAMEKRQQSGKNILYLLQDMREFELYGTVGAVVSVCDSVNYILEEEDLLQVFSLVNNYLYPEGVFVFDFNTVYKYETVIGDTTIAENREECSFIWDNFYHEEEQINEYDLTIFVKEEGGLFRRFSETHYQRGYTPEQMKALVEEAGLRVVEMLDADTHGKVRPDSERVYVIAKEYMKS